MSVENNAENLFLITEQHLRGKIIKNEKLNTEILTENKTHVLGQPNNNDQQQHQHQQIGNNNNFNDNNEIYVDGNDVEELHKKLNKMCRFCLSEDENLRLIFDEYNCISDMFFVFASIQLTQNDGLPEKICFDCLTQLTKCVSFKQQVETAEAVLKHFIEEGYKSGMTLEKIESDNLEKYAEIHSNQFNLEFIGDNNDEFTEQDFNETEYYEDYDIDESQTFSPIQAELCIEMPPENDNNNTIRMDTEKPQILSTAKIKITDQNILPNTDDNLHKNLKPNEIQCPNKDKNNSEEIINQQNDEIKSLNCSFCKKDFKSYSSLARHVKLHIKEKIEIDNYLCNICNITFENLTKKDFQDHIRSHSTNSAVTTTSTTTITTRTIKDDGNKRKLNENSSKKTSFKCEECKVQFIVKTDLYIHGAIHLKPNENGQFICRKCDKIFTDIGKLKRHVRIHFEDKPYKCESCGRGFPEMCSLKRHFRKNHSGRKKERKFICKICDKKYYEAYALMVHTRTHTEEKPYICTECNRCFTDIRLLNSHRKTHLGLRIHACKHCDKKFTHQSTLTTHLRTHTGEKPYACVICNKYFIQSSNLRLHMRVHSGERPYNCDICTKAFASSSALTTHKRTHTGEKPYSCSQCNKSFTRSDLSAHMLTHTKERPFSCTICKKSFTTASQLKVHNRTSHTDEKPYICEICNEQWPSFVYLKKHLLTHKNGEQKNDRTKDLEKIENDNKNITMDNANNSNRNNINNNNISDNNNIGFLGEDNDDAEMNESICLVNDLLAAVAQSDLNTNLL